MVIDERELRDMLKKVRDAYEYGADTVFFPKGFVGKDDLHFCVGFTDWQMFYQDHPFDWDHYGSISVRRLYEQLVLVDRKKVTPEIQEGRIDLEVRIKFNQNVMEENVVQFNQMQLMRVGAGDAFTPELRAQMEKGVPTIAHVYSLEREEGKLEAVLHLKKAEGSDHYFLNRIEGAFTRSGKDEPVGHTFYMTTKSDGKRERLENKYTLKMVYNALAGRPVQLTMTGKDGSRHQVWEQLNLRRKLENGNHQVSRYYPGYGFDLEKVLSQYPIKHKHMLIESLQRGNLQKATFTDKEGTERELYITPNIRVGALHVLDEGGRRISTEQQINQGLIAPELGRRLREHFNVKQETLQPVKGQKHKLS